MYFLLIFVLLCTPEVLLEGKLAGADADVGRKGRQGRKGMMLVVIEKNRSRSYVFLFGDGSIGRCCEVQECRKSGG